MHYKQQLLEQQLRSLCDDLDEYLEEKYGSEYQLKANRLARGKAASGQYDGLFATACSFTPGYGSSYGKGYIVQITICTFDWIEPKRRKEMLEDAKEHVRSTLPLYFPHRKLEVVHDGNVMKIIGDFSLGEV